jgi:hypothetical protein
MPVCSNSVLSGIGPWIEATTATGRFASIAATAMQALALQREPQGPSRSLKVSKLATFWQSGRIGCLEVVVVPRHFPSGRLAPATQEQ